MGKKKPRVSKKRKTARKGGAVVARVVTDLDQYDRPILVPLGPNESPGLTVGEVVARALGVAKLEEGREIYLVKKITSSSIVAAGEDVQ